MKEDKRFFLDGDSVMIPKERAEEAANDPVNHPSHYTDGKIEVIDFIEDKHLNFHRGNVIKYVARAGKKNPATEIEDLKKALWYLKREIGRLEGQKAAEGGAEAHETMTLGEALKELKRNKKEVAAHDEQK